MLSTITIEGWVLMAGIGLPAVCLLLIALGHLFRRKKNLPDQYQIQQQAGGLQMPSFGKEIDRQLLAQEIDRRLVEICHFIQQERARLLMLVPGDYGIGDMELPRTRQQVVPAADRGADEGGRQQNQEIHGLVSELAAKGLPAEQIARSLNLSVTEVDLMLKVRGRGKKGTVAASPSISAVA